MRWLFSMILLSNPAWAVDPPNVYDRLMKELQAACPCVIGVRADERANKAKWKIDYEHPPTPAQRAAVQAVIDGFDPDRLNMPMAPADKLIEVLKAKGIITDQDMAQ